MTKNIRNFSIVAHIDHGKSTLADRIIEYLHAIPQREMKEQVMDRLSLERERGITIRSKTIKMFFQKDNQVYTLNLIDTPGHVDFSFEVMRALSVSDGVILLVDAADGIGAQTMAHSNLAKQLGLKIIPVINKIDLPAADIESVKQQIKNVLNIDAPPLLVSAKFGQGIEELMNEIINKIPPPQVKDLGTTVGVIFDSFYDRYRGVVVYVKILSGELKVGQKIRFMSSEKSFHVEEVGEIRYNLQPTSEIKAGDVGYFITGIKDIHLIEIGDIFYSEDKPFNLEAKLTLRGKLPKSKPYVFADVYPFNSADYKLLKDSIEKIYLTDPALWYSQTYSNIFGPGFRCGFLGVLHADIFKERLEREYNIEIIFTTPSIVYEIVKKDDKIDYTDNPMKIKIEDVKEIRELYVKAIVVTPMEYLDNIMQICKNYRAEKINLLQTDTQKVIINCEFPFSEIMINFYDELKSRSKGMASFDYEFIGYKKSNLVKLTVLIKYQPFDVLSFLVHESKAYDMAKKIATRLKELIPRHLFEIPIQVKMNNRIIAREDIKALRKDVTAHLYGGDVTRKLKLLEKQKEGKKRMKQFGSVSIPPEVFSELLKSI